MSWGVIDTNSHIHVVPVNNSGEIKDPHFLDELCLCDPEIKEENNRLIIIHKEEQ